MTANYERAATAAAETLIAYNINSAPVTPLPILKRIPGVLVVSYEDMSHKLNMDRQCVMDAFCDRHADLGTYMDGYEE